MAGKSRKIIHLDFSGYHIALNCLYEQTLVCVVISLFLIRMGLLRRFAPRNDSKQVNRLRNKCAMTCDLFPHPFGARGKIRSFGSMKENIFSNMVYSLFTFHFSLKQLYKTKKVRIVFPPFSMFIEYYN